MTVKEYVAAANLVFDAVDAAQTTAETAANGIADDVAFLKETITALQNSAGTLTPEDEALVNALDARINGMSTRTTALSGALSDIDSATSRPTPP